MADSTTSGILAGNLRGEEIHDHTENHIRGLGAYRGVVRRVDVHQLRSSLDQGLSDKREDRMRPIILVVCLTLSSASAFAECIGYSGPGGPCYTGPGGGLYTGPGGGAYTGPGGGAYTGPGGGLYTGPGGGAYTGPGGGLYTGPGGGAYTGPGGGAYTGPGGGAYTGPGGGCYSGPGGGGSDKWNRPSPYCK